MSVKFFFYNFLLYQQVLENSQFSPKFKVRLQNYEIAKEMNKFILENFNYQVNCLRVTSEFDEKNDDKSVEE